MSPAVETWDEAIRRLLEANKQHGVGPTTFRQLHFAMGGSIEARKRVVSRVRQHNVAAERTATAIAAGLGVSRSELPAVERPSTRANRARLEALEARIARLEAERAEAAEEVLKSLKALQLAVARLEGQRGSLPMRELRRQP